MMRFPKPLLALILLSTLALLMAGCGDFFVDTTPTNTAKFAFVANNGSGNVSAYTVGNNGALATAPGSPFGAGTSPTAVDADAGGVFVYASNAGGGVSAYTITRSSGALGAVSGSPFTPGSTYAALVVDPAARYVFALNSGTSSVEAYKITSGTGVLTPNGTAVSVGAALTNSMFEDPSGHFVFVAVGAAGVMPLKINTDGTLTAGSVQPAGGCTVSGGARYVTVTPNAKFAYISDNATPGHVCIFSINTSSGALTEVTGGTGGSPITVGGAPSGLAADGLGKFLYATNTADNTVSGFTIAGDGRLTAIAGSPFSVAPATGPMDVDSDPSGQFLYVVNNTSGNVSLFTINGTSGVLTSAGTAGAGTSPVAIVTTP